MIKSHNETEVWFDERKKMKLKNVLIVVKDIERSRKFYHDLFGFKMILDNDGNMIMTEGLVLQVRSLILRVLSKGLKSIIRK